MPRTKPLHEHVSAIVRDAELSNAELAKKTGWSYLRVLRLLHGQTELSAEDMRLLSKVLERPIADLYGEQSA